MTSRYFTYIANKIAAAKLRADSLAEGVAHHGIEGEIREIATRECVEPFLTQSYQVGTGKVIDSQEGLSDQMDLVIYHKKVVPPILVNRDLGLFPVESVRYAIEVKSKLTASEVKDANKKFSTIQQLVSFPTPQPDGTIKGKRLPSTILFAFASDITGSELERYEKHTTNNKRPPCSIIVVLGKGYWFYDYQGTKWRGMDTSAAPGQFAEFCGFITGVMNSLAAEETSLIPFVPGNYVTFDELLMKTVNMIDLPLR